MRPLPVTSVRSQARSGYAATSRKGPRERSSRRRAASGDRRPTPARPKAELAEREGFEPSLLSQTAFRERHHQPLGHLSTRNSTGADPSNGITRDRTRAAAAIGSARAPLPL